MLTNPLYVQDNIERLLDIYFNIWYLERKSVSLIWFHDNTPVSKLLGKRIGSSNYEPLTTVSYGCMHASEAFSFEEINLDRALMMRSVFERSDSICLYPENSKNYSTALLFESDLLYVSDTFSSRKLLDSMGCCYTTNDPFD